VLFIVVVVTATVVVVVTMCFFVCFIMIVHGLYHVLFCMLVDCWMQTATDWPAYDDGALHHEEVSTAEGTLQ